MVARILWSVPFFCFLMGYYAIAWFVGTEVIAVPSLIGRSLLDVVTLLEPYKLSLRILGKAEDPTLPEGTIVSQHPASGQKIKLYQSIGVVVSRQPAPLLAPDVTGCTASEIMAKAEQAGCKIKTYLCESLYPTGRCIAQYPMPNHAVVNKTIVVYVSSGQTPYRIVPDFRDRSFQEVYEFLNQYGLKAQSFPSREAQGKDIYKVVSQNPPAYSFINLNKPPLIQMSGSP